MGCVAWNPLRLTCCRVEIWLSALRDAMRTTLQRLVVQCYEDVEDVLEKYPSQVAIPIA